MSQIKFTSNNLSVYGDTLSANDPIITIGGNQALVFNDNKDRGVEFRWHDGTNPKLGFFGFDASSQQFTYIPDASNTGEVISGAVGSINAHISFSNILATPTTLAGYGISDALPKNNPVFTGILSGPSATLDSLVFNQTATVTPTVGQLSWNATDGTLELGMIGGNVTLQIGQEQFALVLNKTGADLLNGRVVRVTGAQGQRTTVALAQADTLANAKNVIGVLTEDILNNQQGFVTTSGLIHDLDTSAFAENDVLWLSDTVPGGITNVKPTAPKKAIRIGYCVRSHATVGQIRVDLQIGVSVSELDDISFTSLSNGQLLAYNATSETWNNVSSSTVLSGVNTDSLSEGVANLYFTNTRARTAISVSGSLAYNSSTGDISFTDAVTSVAGKTGAVALTSTDVGLGNVDNTSDANKPISTATQTALDAKLALTGTINIGTTAITVNRASGAQSLTGVSIDGSAATVTDAAQSAITSLGTLTGLTSSGVVNITNNTASTNTTTGALVVTGGAGFGGSVNIGGTLSVTGGLPLSNVRDDNGTALYDDSIKNNLLEAPRWGSSLDGWTPYGSQGTNSTAYVVMPNGEYSVVWQGDSIVGNLNWFAGPYSKPIKVYPDRTYRIAIPFRRTSANTDSQILYLGATPASNVVDNLNTSTTNANAYFLTAPLANMVQGKWYMLVAHIYPAGVTGFINQARVIDMDTGDIVYGVASPLNDFNWNASATQFRMRSGLYKVSTATQACTVQWGKPKFEVMDGSESDYTKLFASPAGIGNTLGLIGTNVTINGNKIKKTGGVTATWDAGAYSSVGYSGGAYVRFRVSNISTAYIVGLNTDPATDAGFTGIDYSIYINSSSAVNVRESGTATDNVTTVAVGDILSITYDGVNVKYYKNGTVVRTVPVVITASLYFDCSLFTLNSSLVEDIEFGPLVSTNWADVGNKPTTISGYGITDAVSSSGSFNLGTSSIAFNRVSGAQSLTGISIDGSAATVTGAAQTAITSLGTLTGLTSSGVVNITNATAATNTVSGALIVTGGVGVAGDLFAGTFNSSSATASALTASLARFQGDTNFRLNIRNGAGTAVSTEAARIGLEYSGALNTGISFFRGAGTTGGYLTFSTNNGTTYATLNAAGQLSLAATTATTAATTGALVVTGGIGTSDAVVATNGYGSISTAGNGMTTISYPAGAKYSNAAGNIRGAFAITLPQTWTNTMLSIHIRVFSYVQGQGFDLICTGYTYLPSTQWFNTSAKIIAQPDTTQNYRVRFGHDGTKCVIVIGEENATTGSLWQYPRVEVLQVTAAQNNFTLAQWNTGWAVSVVNDVSTYTFTSTLANTQVNSVTASLGSNIAASTGRNAPAAGVYTQNTTNASLGDTTPVAYWSTLGFGRGTGGSIEIAGAWHTTNSLWYRGLRDTTDNWTAWKEILTSASYNTYSPTLTGTGASGTWGISVTGSAATVTGATQTAITSLGTLTGLTSSGAVSITDTTASSSTSTGALIVTGGLGVGGAVFASSFSGTGSALTALTAGNLSGTIPASVLGNSSVFIGTTSIALNRASGAIALTGITSIDGDAATVDGKSIGTITQWGVTYADTSTSLAGTAAGTAAQLLQSNGSAAPTFASFDMATHMPTFPHKSIVKWATTVDIAPSTFSANVLTNYSNTASINLTTSAGALSATVNTSATVKVGAAVSEATVQVPANTLVNTISSATVLTLYNVPGHTVTTTAITGAAGTATATFAAQAAAPYAIGSTIYVAGTTPATYSGTFTVTACTTTTVSWASAETVTATVQGTITNLVTTAITGNGTTATATFAARTYAPYAVGASITVSGATPATYNGTFTVTACTTSSVSWASTETVTATVQGRVAFAIAVGTTVAHSFAQTIAAFTPDGTAATVGDRVLVKDISTVGGLITGAQYRGIYTVTTVGSTTVPWVLTRASDADVMADLVAAIVSVSAGTANGGRTFTAYTKSTDTLNTTAITYNLLIDQLASSFLPTAPTTVTGVDLNITPKSVLVASGAVAHLAANSLGRLTISAAAASTYTAASTLYIAGTPINSTNVTITDAYSIYVGQGRSYFTSGAGLGGALQAVGLSAGYGALASNHTLSAALNVIMGTASSATWLLSGTSNNTFRGGIQLLDAGGAMRLYSNTTTGLAVVGSDLQPFTTGTGNIGTTSLRFASVNANGANIAGNILASGATSVIGYTTGSGGTVTQATSRTTSVTLNKSNGAITLFSTTTTAGQITTFTLTNSTIAATDVVTVSVKTATGIYFAGVSATAAGSCNISIFTPTAVGVAEAPVISFAVIKAVVA